MKIHDSITFERIEAAIAADDYIGFCISCGAEASGVEPDAREHVCDSCGECGVYGAEELLVHVAT